MIVPVYILYFRKTLILLYLCFTQKLSFRYLTHVATWLWFPLCPFRATWLAVWLRRLKKSFPSLCSFQIALTFYCFLSHNPILSQSLSLLSCSSLSLCVLLPLPPFLPVFVVYNHLSFGWRTNLWNKNVLCSASFVELMEAHGHSRSSIKFLAHNSTTSIHSSHSPYPLFLGIFVRVCVCECVVMEKYQQDDATRTRGASYAHTECNRVQLSTNTQDIPHSNSDFGFFFVLFAAD